ncbi:MAG: RNA polymerase sigma factor [Desertimonas sp.]
MDRNGDAVDQQIAGHLDAARAGDSDAFTAIYHALAGKVAGFVRGRGVRDVDDVVNEVFLGVFRNFDTFEGDASAFRSWLFTIARYKATDAIRAAVRTPTAGAAELPDASGGDVEVDAMAHLGDETVAMLDLLTDEQREVVLLRIIADLSLAQVAEITDRPLGAVKSIQHRALASLRRQLRPPVSDLADRTIADET